MPIASDRSPGIQIGPIASVGSANAPVQPIGDLMDAFKSGFITVDDIVRREKQNMLETDRLKTELQSGDFQRKLAPGAFDNSMAAQGLQADQIQAAKSLLPGSTSLALGQQSASQDEQSQQAALRSPDDTVRNAAISHETQTAYERATGAVAPKSFKIAHPNPEPVPTFSKWINETKGPEVEKAVENFEGITPEKAQDDAEKDILNFTSGFPLNSPQDNVARAQFDNKRRAELAAFEERRAQYGGDLMKSFADSSANHAEFKKVEDAARNQKVVVKQGTPEYNDHIKSLLTGIQDRAALREAQLKAAPKILETRAEAPLKAAEAQGKAQGDVLLELHKSESLKRFEPQFEAFEKVDAIRSSGRTPTNSDDIAVMYEFVKLLDPTSAVREGEAKLAQSTNPFVIQLYNKGKALFVAKDKILGADARADMFNTMDTLKAGALKTVAPEIKRISAIAIDRGVPLNQVFTGPYQAILTGGTSAPSGGVRKPSPHGDQIIQKGVRYRWDGSDYVALP